MSLSLPAEPYTPGRTPRPDPELFEPLKAGLSARLSIAALAESAAFRCGHDAYVRGYFWEAHELWEAVWTCLPPASAERHMLRGLIQLANARLKRRMGRTEAAARIDALADDAFQEAFLHGAETLMGLSRADIAFLGSHG